VDEPDCACDRWSRAAHDRAASLRFVGEWHGQEGGAGAGEDERDDRLACGGLHGDLRGDVDGGEYLLKEHSG
jgi:hypothetical protein